MKWIIGLCFTLMFFATGTAFGFDQAADKPPSASLLQKAQPLTYVYLPFGSEPFFASGISVSGQKKRKQMFEY